MAKISLSKKAMPAHLKSIIQTIGHNIQVARKRRRMTQKELAGRVLCSVPTIRRLEDGDAGTSINILVQVLWVFGMQDQLLKIASPTIDSRGIQLEIERMPKSIRKQKQQRDMDF